MSTPGSATTGFSTSGTHSTGTIQDRQRWFPFVNDSGETIPPFSIVQLTDGERLTETEGYRVHTIGEKPTGEPGSILAITGVISVPASTTTVDTKGKCTQDFPTWVAYDPAEGTPQNGDYYKAVAAQWFASPGGSDFIVIGPPVTDSSGNTRVLVTQVNNPSEGSGGGNPENCPCCPACVCCPTDATLYTTACAAFPKLFLNYTLSGATPWGGRTLVWDSGCIFYSASFNITVCGVDYGSHRWKWTAAEAIDTSILTLEEVGTAATVIALRYKNKWHLDPWCGNDFGIIERWLMPCAIAHLPPKVMCISPVADICQQCADLIPTTCCPTGLPRYLQATITSTCANMNGQVLTLAYVSGRHWEVSFSGGSCGTCLAAFDEIGSGGACLYKFDIQIGANVCFTANVSVQCPITGFSFPATGWSGIAACSCCASGGTTTVAILPL